MVTAKSGEVGLSDSRHFPGSFPIVALHGGGLLHEILLELVMNDY
jgi:hypothetical protein